MHLTATVAKILKNDIKSRPVPDYKQYPGDKTMQKDEALSYLPDLLQLLLKNLLAGKDSNIKVASVGQAIMQASRPRTVIAPLQLGLRMQFHHQFALRFLIDTRNQLGF